MKRFPFCACSCPICLLLYPSCVLVDFNRRFLLSFCLNSCPLLISRGYLGLDRMSYSSCILKAVTVYEVCQCYELHLTIWSKMDRLLGWWVHIWVFRMHLPRLLACWCCWWAWWCLLLNVDAVLWDLYSLGKGIRTLRPPGMTLLLGIWSSWPVSIRSLSSANVRIRGSSSLLSWSDDDDVGNGTTVVDDLGVGPSWEDASYSLASSSVIEFPDVLYIVGYVNTPRKKVHVENK